VCKSLGANIANIGPQCWDLANMSALLAEFSSSTGAAGEYCKVTGGLLWKANLSLEASKI